MTTFTDQALGDIAENLAAQHPLGICTPSALVDAARPKRSPLHDRYVWNDTEAGELYRLEQARAQLRTVRVVIDDVRQDAPAFVVVRVATDDGSTVRGYQPLRVALMSAVTREQVLADATRLLEGAWGRVASLEAALGEGQLAELGAVRRAIAKLAKTTAATV